MTPPDAVRSPGVHDVATGSPGPGSSAAFAARALAARERYDAVLARSLAHGADRDTLADAVREVGQAAGPLAERLDADAFAATCDALVETVARLAAARRWRPGGPERHAVLEVVPRLGPWLAAAPALTVAAVVDGARAVGGGPGSRGDVTAWARRVVHAAGTGSATGSGPGGAAHDPWPQAGAADGPSPDVIRGAVLVAAWRSGLVRYRQVALDAARSLPEPVARAALSLSGPDARTGDADLRDVLDRHAADPWWWPDPEHGNGGRATTTVLLRGFRDPARVLGRFGGFRGFGGPWRSPALVVGADARHPGLRWALLATGDGTTGDGATGRSAGGTTAETVDWTLVADVHGSLVARTPRTGSSAEAGAWRDAGTADRPPGPTGGGPAPEREDDLTDVSGSAEVDTPSGRLALLSRTGSYDLLLVRWPR